MYCPSVCRASEFTQLRFCILALHDSSYLCRKQYFPPTLLENRAFPCDQFQQDHSKGVHINLRGSGTRIKTLGRQVAIEKNIAALYVIVHVNWDCKVVEIEKSIANIKRDTDLLLAAHCTSSAEPVPKGAICHVLIHKKNRNQKEHHYQ